MDPIRMDFTSSLVVFTLAIVSPGPNFILAVNRFMTGSRAEGLWISLEVAVGSSVYGLCGLPGLIVLLDSVEQSGLLIRLTGGFTRSVSAAS